MLQSIQKKSSTCIIVWSLMHTSNQGLIHTFKFSAVLIICSLLWVFPSLCSLPAFPFPRSLPEAVIGVCDSHESPPLQVCAFPSLLLPSHCSLPSFPIDDYVPALFPYWRLCSRPLSLLPIMLLLPFPIFDYALTLSVPDVLMLLLQDCWKCNFM
jgi:hypothetical protein